MAVHLPKTEIPNDYDDMDLSQEVALGLSQSMKSFQDKLIKKNMHLLKMTVLQKETVFEYLMRRKSIHDSNWTSPHRQKHFPVGTSSYKFRSALQHQAFSQEEMLNIFSSLWHRKPKNVLIDKCNADIAVDIITQRMRDKEHCIVCRQRQTQKKVTLTCSSQFPRLTQLPDGDVFNSCGSSFICSSCLTLFFLECVLAGSNFKVPTCGHQYVFCKETASVEEVYAYNRASAIRMLVT